MSRSDESFGRIIRDRRRRNDLTQEEIARRIGTSTPYVGHLESGKRHPSDEIVSRLADALGFERRDLFFLANPQAKELLHSKPKGQARSAWEEFRRNEQVHHEYRITDKEMRMLSQVALMGEVRSWRDFIYILNTVRQALSA